MLVSVHCAHERTLFSQNTGLIKNTTSSNKLIPELTDLIFDIVFTSQETLVLSLNISNESRVFIGGLMLLWSHVSLPMKTKRVGCNV